ncbi:C-GCAxxG-C-C family (seleno)protein [Trichloromonas sp.]|uniref:C-GCAxxG-C-C family (seleno)protein n=1 Tax=Trichloromonas sp. TaxID=3069249 RepID=UPI002A4D1D08|nr:C-GCAxxG-C-C family (seleno)protein [Trichloromonas sp.]
MSNREGEGTKRGLSRRTFVASGLAAGTALVGGTLYAAMEKKEDPKPAAPSTELPWSYVRLDPWEASRRAHDHYLDKDGCGTGAWLGLLSLLREKVGFPYTALPDRMFDHASNGYANQGTLCGALGACAAVINLVAYYGQGTHKKLIENLFTWYANTPLPSVRFDAISAYPDQVQVTPHSPLCHVSESTWAGAAGAAIGSEEKRARCAKVTAETVYQTVVILNEYLDAKFAPVSAGLSAETHYCLSCHGPRADDNQQGMMTCTVCHDDHTQSGRAVSSLNEKPPRGY